ncbi:MAG TPA: LCP family protein [Actinomycetota bacterium]|nr:LCP family protein [Actinomycetota bacterium]
MIAVAAVLVVVAVIAGTNAVVDRGDDRGDDRANSATGAANDQTTYLVVGTETSSSGLEVSWMTLIGVDPAASSASIAYLPAHTAYEVPGQGLQGIGDALSTGGVSLISVSVENMLGVPIDHFIELPADDAEALFEQTGDLTVNVPQEVRVSAGADTAQVLFDAGEQVLPPRFQTDLLYEVGLDGDESELGSRHLAFWQSFVETHSADPQALESAMGAASGSLDSSDTSPAEQASFFNDLVSLSPEEVTISSLPVEEEVTGETELYSISDDDIRSFVGETFGEAPNAGNEVRVQILNGNGQPGMAQAVAERLVGKGYRVVLSGNANELDYEDTRIVIYESTPEAQAAGERARELLGVGNLQVSVQQQGIVDLTIVVGKDFIEATETEDD